MSRVAQASIDAFSLGLLPCVLVVCAVMDIGASALLALAASIAALLVFIAGWERSQPALRQMMPCCVLAAVAVVGRVLFAVAPNVQPVTAICIIGGAVFGKRCGFMTGALAGLVSSLFMGFGAWTPWQMYSWGLVGYLSGMMFGGRHCGESKARVAAVCVVGALGSFLYGFVMNTWTLVGFVHPITWQSAVAVYGAGLAFDVAHAASTVVFLSVLYAPWCRKLGRVAMKYDLATIGKVK